MGEAGEERGEGKKNVIKLWHQIVGFWYWFSDCQQMIKQGIVINTGDASKFREIALLSLGASDSFFSTSNPKLVKDRKLKTN